MSNVDSHRRFPVEWNGVTYYLGYITNAVKLAFCAWLEDHLVEEATARIRNPAVLNRYLDHLFAGMEKGQKSEQHPWWGAGVFSETVFTAVNSTAGSRKLNRLLLGDSGKALSDADLEKLITEKEAEQLRKEKEWEAAGGKPEGDPPQWPPANDFTRAMRQIVGHEFPKVAAAGASGPDPTAAPNTSA